jgi:hypothetical protein
VTYRRALDVPLRMQWDPSSRLPLPDPGTAPGNCGPTAVTQVAEFYKDRYFGIYSTRRRVTASQKPSTTVGEQRRMLELLGVPCSLQRPTVSQLKAHLATGRRPLILGMDMSKVPIGIAGHPFRGDHAVTLRANAPGGFLVADPNFSTRTNRLDATKGRRFYPDWVIDRAYYRDGKWAIVPHTDKIVSLPDTGTPGKPILADGDPAPMRYRSLVNQDTGALPAKTVKKGKPIRKGATVSSALWATVPANTVIRPFGYIDKDDLPAAERQYGDVFLTNWYQTNGEHIGYIKSVDLQ